MLVVLALASAACQRQVPDSPTEHAIRKTQDDDDKAGNFLNADSPKDNAATTATSAPEKGPPPEKAPPAPPPPPPK